MQTDDGDELLWNDLREAAEERLDLLLDGRVEAMLCCKVHKRAAIVDGDRERGSAFHEGDKFGHPKL